MESLIEEKVLMKFEMPLTEEVFTIIGETRDEVKIEGDFSASGYGNQSEWRKKSEIRHFVKTFDK